MARRQRTRRDVPDRESEEVSGQPQIGGVAGLMLGLQRRAGNHAVQRMLDARGEQVQRAILDPTYEDEVFEVEEAKRRAKLSDAAGGKIAAADPRKAALESSVALNVRQPYAGPAQAAPGRLAAADPRKATTQSALVTSGLLPAPARPAAPLPGQLAPNDPRKATTQSNLVSSGALPYTAPARAMPGTLAGDDPRKAMVGANVPLRAGAPAALENLAKKREAEEQKAREEAKAKAYASFLSSVGVDPAKHTEYFLQQVAHHYGRWAKAAAVAQPEPYQKAETKEYKDDLDLFLKNNLERDKKEMEAREQDAENERLRKEYATRFEALLGMVLKNITPLEVAQQVVLLLKAVKAEIDAINTKSGNVSSNFGSDLQAEAKGTYSPGVVARAGDVWSVRIHRFAANDHNYRGPHQKGAQSASAKGKALPQANFEAPLGKGAKGKVNVHVNTGYKKGSADVDAYVHDVAAAKTATGISIGEIIKMAQYYDDKKHPLGVRRQGKSYFSDYDIANLKHLHATTHPKPWYP